jgi:hypothetical protein
MWWIRSSRHSESRSAIESGAAKAKLGELVTLGASVWERPMMKLLDTDGAWIAIGISVFFIVVGLVMQRVFVRILKNTRQRCATEPMPQDAPMTDILEKIVAVKRTEVACRSTAYAAGSDAG